MFFNQELKVGVACGVVSLAFAVAGCSSHRGLSRAESPADSATAVASAPASPDADMTATQAAISHADAGPSASAQPVALTREAINPGAPMRYTVKHGDTLWGISTMYLRDPWLWPEIWYDNPQVANPHLIYPGDVLVLAYGADGRPQIHVERGSVQRGGAARLEPRLRSSPLEGAIPTIPYSAIAAFLSRPSLLSAHEVDRAPHVLAFPDDHQAGGSGDNVYARGLHAAAGARFIIVHVGDKLRDPDNGRVLGYEGLYTATAVVVRPGKTTKLAILDSARETLRGDVLLSDDATSPLTVVPRAPLTPVRGRIISVIDNVHLIGQYNIIAINRGKRQGVDAGTVLAVDQAGQVVQDRGSASYDDWGRSDTFARHVRLPDERAGTVLVFKAYDRMSYALVVGASEQMRIADIVRNP